MGCGFACVVVEGSFDNVLKELVEQRQAGLVTAPRVPARSASYNYIVPRKKDGTVGAHWGYPKFGTMQTLRQPFNAASNRAPCPKSGVRTSKGGGMAYPTNAAILLLLLSKPALHSSLSTCCFHLHRAGRAREKRWSSGSERASLTPVPHQQALVEDWWRPPLAAPPPSRTSPERPTRGGRIRDLCVNSSGKK